MYTFQDLTDIIAKLRSDGGCPWDRAQTYESLKKCLADEAQEVYEAVDNHDKIGRASCRERVSTRV